MNEKTHDDDDYKLPPGIILPQDDSPDYPNWKKGLITGIPSGIFCGFILAASPLNKTVMGKIGLGVVGFFIGFLLAGVLVAYRPPKN
jgi:hypothetical protein